QAEPAAQPERFKDLDFVHFFLQPLDDERRESNTRAAIDFCLKHPQWRLSVQTHKVVGID
ncbi:MAG TPA: 7-carboxy-7-deazaguanine synthase, partial [Woeseiaceae bacterium]|nr:7-carboxy-7-deazaguanine synthase [Woeseiaceae bacterium]